MFTLNESIKYFVQNGSSIHCILLHARRLIRPLYTMDLFYEMINKGISIAYTNFCCTHLHCAELWKSLTGEIFSVKCDVRQGGVLSPDLFSFYTHAELSLLSLENLFTLFILVECS